MKACLVFFFAFVSLLAKAQPPTLENNKLKLANPVALFNTGTATLTADGKTALLAIKDFLAEKTYISTLRIEGHLDNSISGTAAQKLSEARALAVCKWLVNKGVDCKRLIAVGFGDTKPVAENKTPEGRAQNNRVEFIVAGLRNRPVGGMPYDGGGKVAGNPCE